MSETIVKSPREYFLEIPESLPNVSRLLLTRILRNLQAELRVSRRFIKCFLTVVTERRMNPFELGANQIFLIEIGNQVPPCFRPRGLVIHSRFFDEKSG